MTPTEFKSKSPEFDTAPEEVVQVALDEASAELDETALGGSYPAALRLLTAHKLALSPYGSNARIQLESGAITSTYIQEFREVVRRRIFPGFSE